MTAHDLTGLLDSDLSDRTDRLVLSDALEDAGDGDAAEMLRTLEAGLAAADEGRRLLRESGLVEPHCLRLSAGGDWHWCLYRALPGHPAPGNAGVHTYPAPAGIRAETRGRCEWLGRLFARVARDRGHVTRAACPGTWAVLAACQQFLRLPKNEGGSVNGELFTLDLMRE
jgi:hypothetical protein